MTSPEPIPLGLYVHLPWCVRKCPYCDFNSHAQRDELPERDYIEALLRDLESELPAVWGRRVSSIFIGGGTPSLFSAGGIDTLLQGIRARLAVTAGAEITLEANPGTAEAQRFAGYREAGVNRLSLGIQSFQDHCLSALGRIHDGDQAQRAIELAKQAGFERINLDLMFGLPGQSPEQAAMDIDTALALDASLQLGHLSWYQLTLEPNTLFHRHPPTTLPSDDRVAVIQEQGIQQLQRAGFGRYEVSAFARPGQRCRHNINYWEFGDYIGIGAGAHGKVSSHNHIRRRWRYRHPSVYIEQALNGSAVAGERELDQDDLALEFLMNALRLTDGVAASLFGSRTRLALNSVEPILATARERGWMARDSGRLQATAQGMRWLNDLLELFLPD